MLVLVCLFNPAARALNPNLPPGSNFDLSHWKLQLPTSNGVLTAASGSVDETNAPYLMAGFTNSYFYTGPDGSMMFWAPDNGARTGGSSHPRSELREMINPNDGNVNWYVYGTHIMTATCKVLQVASDTKKVCIGQMHEPNNRPDGSTSAGNEQMIMFDLKNLKIYANISLDGNTKSSFSTNLITGSSVALSNTIGYTMSMVNGLMKIIVNNKTNTWDLLSGMTNQGDVAQNWDLASLNTLYFKAGDYNQTTNACNCSTDGSKVAFYYLNVYHAPSITNQPANQVVAVGSNVAFNVGALGNPPLRYFWLFNGSPMSGKTNAALSIPNVQLTNAGNYSVIVTDSMGTVSSIITSSVATLTVNPLAPTADFIASPTNGVAPLNVNFTDTSGNSPTNWAWSFGDGGTSTLQNPSHSYTAGVYTVQLIARNGGGSSTNTKTAYINVITPLQSWSAHYAVNGDATDADGDGMSNTNEFLGGFNPTSPAAYLRIISVSKSGDDINITYLGANGDNAWSPGLVSRTNVLECAAGSADGGYINNFVSAGQTNILSGGDGSGIITNMIDPGGATNVPARYYRVRVLAP